MKRMQGFNVLFQPGYDHAGISTQNAVEKHLAAEGKTRQELGREAFEARVWEWLREYGGKIMVQFRRIGASLDYRRERFTMDDDVRPRGDALLRPPAIARAGSTARTGSSTGARSTRPRSPTSSSSHVDVDDALTLRPLPARRRRRPRSRSRPCARRRSSADVAVAVHPDDERYRDLVGREVIVPFVERRVPVIADERVEPDFGTGALKITPGHDPIDFEIGRDHGLPEPTVIGPDGRMNDAAGELAGLTQEEADERILDWCEERGLLEKREPYRHTVALCERCETRIEPLISLQWWCAMEELKQPALEALRAGRVRYHPESQHRFAIDSLENAPDWNISRQIWWGHQLPVWYCPDGHVTVEETEPEACAECGSRELTRSDGRARHVVLVGALAVRDARLARRHRGPAHVLPGRPEHDRARDHPPLGEPDDLLRARADGRGPVPATSSSTRRVLAPDGRPDVEEPRHRHRPARRDRRRTAPTRRATGC